MRKISMYLVVAVLLAGIGSGGLSFAQGMHKMTGNEPVMKKEMMKGGWLGKGDMPGRCVMNDMMMKGMMERSMIAAVDGGVIVLAGNKLIKYDKDLNVVKEVEIATDMEAVQKKMMRNCDMMKGGMMEEAAEEKAEQKK